MRAYTRLNLYFNCSSAFLFACEVASQLTVSLSDLVPVVSTYESFLICFSSLYSHNGCNMYAATGTTITVPFDYTLKASDNLRWLKDTTVIFQRRNKKVIQGKTDDVDTKGFLKLTHLTKDKSGLYTPEAHSADGVSVGDLKAVRLCVLDPVKKPNVTTKCTSSGPENKVEFTCNVHRNDKDITIKWFADDKKNKMAEKEKTAKLLVPAKDVENTRFSCNVSNPVSFEISQPIQQTCYGPTFPEELFGISIWVFVGGGAGVVLVLILIVIICCIRAKRKRRMRLKDEGELRLQWSNQERQQHQQQHHHHHHQHQHQHQNHPDQHQHQHPHHHQQQPAGNTGPRQPRSKQQRAQQRPRAPDPPNGHPQPSPRRAAQVGH
uniref:Ig-like domain-containing protein n=1 Tax=Amphilophus citrinellus TaxID=61819 RepID=A0A3Q0S3C1_AMPCI